MDPSPENAPCWHDQYRPREICQYMHIRTYLRWGWGARVGMALGHTSLGPTVPTAGGGGRAWHSPQTSSRVASLASASPNTAISPWP